MFRQSIQIEYPPGLNYYRVVVIVKVELNLQRS